MAVLVLFRLVNCRVGSLEMENLEVDDVVKVNCRVGSLEIYLPLYVRLLLR